MKIFGSTHGLRFVFHKIPREGNDPISATWGTMQLWIGKTLIWGHFEEKGRLVPFEWSWFEMLEFLADAWPYLQGEERTPVIFEELSDLKYLISTLHSRWETLSDNDIETEDELLQDFLTVHDLSRGIEGAWPEPVILLRQGNEMLAASSEKTWWLNYQETMHTLEELGNYIQTLLNGSQNGRAHLIMERWNNRNELSELKKTVISTGWSEERIENIFPANAENFLPQLRAVARMTSGAMSDDSIKVILESLSTATYQAIQMPTELLTQVETILHDYRLPFFEQGNKLANLVREFLNNPSDPVDVEELLTSWAVRVVDLTFDMTVDAVAVWESETQGAVFVNLEGHRSKFPTGRRFTLAHEIAHLLADRQGALPLAEVIGGQIYKPVEQRANAFAAEFLLPRQAVKIFLDKTPDDISLADVINTLTEKFKVSHEMAAWQYQKVTGVSRETINSYIKSIHDPHS